jgi:hypothetical protein
MARTSLICPIKCLWDAPFVHTAKRYARDAEPSVIWEGHKAGRDIGYCLFTDREGGVEHCSADNMEPARSYIGDWIARTFSRFPVAAR